jgi:putative nucleotidyltransferase with HDIG domain
LFRKLRGIWADLGRSIYDEKRLQSNMIGITFVSILSTILGLVMLFINIFQHKSIYVIETSVVFIVAGSASAVASGILKKRNISEAIGIFACVMVFTYYALSGSMNGFSISWALVMPIGVCYFISVKLGIITSVYYELLLCALFYIPSLRENMSVYYSEITMTRFPIVFFAVSSVTTVAMVDFHLTSLKEMDYTDKLNGEVERQTAIAVERARRLETVNDEVVNMLAVAIDARDRYTNGHSLRVAAYTAALARKTGLDENLVKNLRREATLHDIGKIGIPDSVLNKPGKLTDREYDIIKSHTTIGADILARSKGMDSAVEVAKFHHERYDGSGYPCGLSGDSIPLHARIVAIADAYDAMSSDRIYRNSMEPGRIRSELIRGKGTQFDPALLDPFLELLDSGELDAIRKETDQLRELSDELDLLLR